MLIESPRFVTKDARSGPVGEVLPPAPSRSATSRTQSQSGEAGDVSSQAEPLEGNMGGPVAAWGTPGVGATPVHQALWTFM